MALGNIILDFGIKRIQLVIASQTSGFWFELWLAMCLYFITILINFDSGFTGGGSHRNMLNMIDKLLVVFGSNCRSWRCFNNLYILWLWPQVCPVLRLMLLLLGHRLMLLLLTLRMNLLVLCRQIEWLWRGWYNFDVVFLLLLVLRQLLMPWLLLLNFNLILIVDRVYVDSVWLARFILFIRNNWSKCTWYLIGREKWGEHYFRLMNMLRLWILLLNGLFQRWLILKIELE